MGSIVSNAVDELYTNGLTGILKIIPRSFDSERRQLLEAVVFSANGICHSYQRLEELIESNTQEKGNFSDDYKLRRELFLLAWTFVDSAYSLSSLSNLKVASELFKLPDEIKSSFQDVRKLRNYMDHLSSNFANAASAKGHAPLFGWMSFQFTPIFQEPKRHGNEIFVTLVASSILKDRFHIDVTKHSSLEVFGVIDNITLHIKDGIFLNLSRLLADFTIVLNDWSIQIQQMLVGLLEDKQFDHRGLNTPFPQIVARGELGSDRQIRRVTLDETLNRKKFRVEVEHNPN